jgi:hypothetical protein
VEVAAIGRRKLVNIARVLYGLTSEKDMFPPMPRDMQAFFGNLRAR